MNSEASRAAKTADGNRRGPRPVAPTPGPVLGRGFAVVFRNGLTVISGYSELLPTAGEELGAYAEIIRASALRLAAAVETILHLEQLGADPEGPPEPCAVDALVGHAVEAVSATHPDRRYELDLTSGSWVAVSPVRLRRVVDHLLANAALFSPAGSPVTVATHRSGPWWLLAVADRGRGIAPDQHERAFERFVRLGGDAPAGPVGAGLGLALVRETARHYGGDAWIDANAGGGTVVSVSLPLAAADGRTAAARPS